MKHYKVKKKKANMGAIVNDDSKSDVKKTVRQTARRQMSEARDAKKQAKEFIRDYDEAGGFTFEGQKKQAKQNVRSRFRKINADEFIVAALLPVARFKKKGSKYVHAKSRGMI